MCDPVDATECHANRAGAPLDVQLHAAARHGRRARRGRRALLTALAATLVACGIDKLTSVAAVPPGFRFGVVGDSAVVVVGSNAVVTLTPGPGLDTVATVLETRVVDTTVVRLTSTGRGSFAVQARKVGSTQVIVTARTADFAAGFTDTVRVRVRYNGIRIVAPTAGDSVTSLGDVRRVSVVGLDLAGAPVGAVSPTTIVVRDTTIFARRSDSVVARANGLTRVYVTLQIGADPVFADSVPVRVRQVAKRINLTAGGPAPLVLTALNWNRTLAVQVLDARDSVVSAPAIGWLSSDTTIATVTGAGVVRTRRLGTTSITARVDTVALALPVRTTQVVATIGRTSGDLQGGTVATVLPAAPAIVLRDSGGAPIGGVAVTFAAVTGGGTVTNGTVTSDTATATLGTARPASWRLRTTPGIDSVVVAAGGLTTVFVASARAVGAVAARLVFSGQPGTGAASLAIPGPLTVTIQDSLGGTVTSATDTIRLYFGDNPSGATMSGGLAVAAVSGVATFPNVRLSASGTGYTLLASGGGYTPARSNAFALTGAPVRVRFVTAPPASATAGVAFAPSTQLEVVDAFGVRVVVFNDSIFIAMAAATPGAVVGGRARILAVNGAATFDSLVITAAGTWAIGGSASGLASATSATFTVQPGPAARLAYLVQPSGVAPATPMSPGVQVAVQDAFGNLLPAATSTVTLTLVPLGGGTGPALNIAASGGVATFNALSIAASGAGYTYVASAPGLAPATSLPFTVRAPGPPVALSFAQQPPAVLAAGGTIAPAVLVTLRDTAGIPATGTPTITLTLAANANPGNDVLTGAALSVAASGLSGATFSGLSLKRAAAGYRIVASSPGLKPDTSAALTVNPAAATKLTFASPPGGSIVNKPMTPVVVAVTDTYGNVVPTVTDSVTVSLSAGPTATFNGTRTRAAVAGVAQFDDLSVTATGTTFAMQAVSNVTGHASIASSAFVIAAAVQRVRLVTPPAGGLAGAPFASPMVVAMQDASGNTITSDSSLVTLSLAANFTGSALGGTVTRRAVNGLATFAGVFVNRLGTGLKVVATSGGLVPDTSSGFAMIGAPFKLVFLRQPGTSIQRGVIRVGPQLVVQDSLGTVVPSSTAFVTLALGSNPVSATLSGLLSVGATGTGSVASFDSLMVSTGYGAHTFVATSSGLQTVTSAPFLVSPYGNANQLGFLTQPSNVGVTTTMVPPVQVAVLDSLGNTLTGGVATSITLGFGANPGGGTLLGGGAVTSVAGVATYAGLQLAVAGTGYTFTAAATGLPTKTSTAFTVQPAGPPARLRFVTQPGSTVAASAFSPAIQVRLTDTAGITISTAAQQQTVQLSLFGLSPAASAAAFGGSLPTATTVNGIATFTGAAVALAGASYKLVLASSSLPSLVQDTSVAFTVSVGGPSALKFLTQPAATVVNNTAFSPPITVAVVDAGGNTVSTATDTVTLSSSGVPLGGTLKVVAVAGIATFSAAQPTSVTFGTTQLNASASARVTATSSNFTVVVGSPVALKFLQQPPASVISNAVFSPSVRVAIVDAGGNTVTTATDSVYLAPGTTGTGIALGGLSATAAVSGVATFTGLKAVGLLASQTLVGVATGRTSATSATFAVTVGPVVAMQYLVQPPAAVISGSVIAPAVQIALIDAGGNVVPSAADSVFISLASGGAGFTLGAPARRAAAAGVATFTGTTVTGVINGQQLVASSPGRPTLNSASFNVTFGTPVALRFTQQPGLVNQGQPFPAGTGPKISVLDAANNVVANDSSVVTLDIAIGPTGGSLAGTVVRRAVNGVADFSDITVGKLFVGYKLVATAPFVSPDTSSAFTVVGPAFRWAVTTPPASGVRNAPFSIAVQARDSLGTPRNAGTIAVIFAIGSNPGAGTLTGTTSTNATAASSAPGAPSQVTVTDLKINNAGTGYTIVVSGASLAPATSVGFDQNAFGTAKALSFTVQPPIANTSIALSPAPRVTVVDSAGNPVTSSVAAISMAFSSNGTGAVLGGTLIQNAVAGSATFPDLTVDKIGPSYAIQATSPGLTSVASSAFSVVDPSSPCKLAFVQQPSTTEAASIISPPIKVAIQTCAGVTVTSSSAPVTIALGANPTGLASTMSGSALVNAASGIATFPDLQFSRAANGYTLQVTAAGLSGATSAAFTITPGLPVKLVQLDNFPAFELGRSQPFTIRVAITDAQGNTVNSPGTTNLITSAIGGGCVGYNSSQSGQAIIGYAFSGPCTPASLEVAGPSANAVAGVATIDFSAIRPRLDVPFGIHFTSPGLTATGYNYWYRGNSASTISSATQLAFEPLTVTPPTANTPFTAPNVVARDSLGNNAAMSTGLVTLSVGSAAGGSVLGVTVRAWNCNYSFMPSNSGCVTFSSVRITQGAASGVTLVATYPGLTSATTTPFSVTAFGAPVRIGFLQQPTTVKPATSMTPAVTVAVLDAVNNVVTSGSISIALGLGTNPSGSTLSGAAAVATVSGVATFPGLQLSALGTGYTLIATTASYASATSAPFDVTVLGSLVMPIGPSSGPGSAGRGGPKLAAPVTPSTAAPRQRADGSLPDVPPRRDPPALPSEAEVLALVAAGGGTRTRRSD